MTHRTPIVLSLTSLLLLMLVGGCGSNGQSVTFSSVDQKKVFAHAFPEAYISRGTEGDLDVFLVEDGLSLAEQKSTARRPLEAAPASSRQIVHVHVVWTPMRNMRGDHPAATNAVVHWYVLGAGGAHESANLLHYTGSGYVKVILSRTDARVTLANISLRLRERRGDLTDPLGPATLSGEFSAKVSDTNVKALLAEVRGFTPAVARGE